MYRKIKGLLISIALMTIAITGYADEWIEYRANPNNACDEQSRVCCYGDCKGWDASFSCPNCDASDKCYDGTSTCASKPSTSRACVGNVSNACSGNQTRSPICNVGSGTPKWGWTDPSWSSSGCVYTQSCTDTSRACSGNVSGACSGTQTRSVTGTCGSCSYGIWTGTCTCASGYTWNGTSCVASTYYLYWESTVGYSQCDGSSNCLQSSIPCCSPDTPTSGVSSCQYNANQAIQGRCLSLSRVCYVAYCRLPNSSSIIKLDLGTPELVIP